MSHLADLEALCTSDLGALSDQEVFYILVACRQEFMAGVHEHKVDNARMQNVLDMMELFVESLKTSNNLDVPLNQVLSLLALIREDRAVLTKQLQEVRP